MMKTILVFLIILFSDFSFSQHLVGVNSSIGFFLYNSENDLQLLKKRTLYEYYAFGLSYETSLLSTYNIQIDYSYSKSTRNGVIKPIRTDETGNQLEVLDIDYYLLNHNIDLIFLFQFDDSEVQWGLGPSMVITNRSLYFPGFFNDILASSGIGVCATIESFPIFRTTQDLYSARIYGKIRYTKAIWFDTGIRKLDTYEQQFFDSLIGVRFLFNLSKL